MKYRLAEGKDVYAIFDIIKAVRKDNPYYYSVDDIEYYRSILSKNTCIVCENGNGLVVGSCLSYFDEGDSNGVLRLASIEECKEAVLFKNYQVLPQYQGKGIGYKMGRCLLDTLSEKYKYAVASVHPDNTPSRVTLFKLGFSKVAEAKIYGGRDRLILKANLSK